MTSFTFPQYGLVIEADNIDEANKKMQEIMKASTQTSNKNEKVEETGEKMLDPKKIKNKGSVSTSKK